MDIKIQCLETQNIADLGCFTRTDVNVAGGKGANLGELLRAGFPVPGGFVITTDVYEQFVRSQRMSTSIDELLTGKDLDVSAVRAAFEHSPMPSEMVQAILAAYTQIGQGPVAVRSSATAEDLPGAAFAGQQDTYLNVIGAQALLQAVQNCWASLWSERAIAYRQRQGIDHQQVKIAVVVQKMVMPDVAGVMFTANPVTGARNEVVVDANPGLGEAVVSGRVTPDHIVLQRLKGSWHFKERTAGRRELVVRPVPAGGTEERVGKVGKHTSLLPRRVLLKLAGLGLEIEHHFGSPQDIEWAYQEGELFILQARPITALSDYLSQPGKPVQMLSAMFAEMFPIRPYPLDMSTWMKALSAAAVEPIFSLIGITPPAFEQLFEQQDGVVTRFTGEVHVHPTARVLLTPARLVWLALRYDPSKWGEDALFLDAQQRTGHLASLQLTMLTWTELLNAITEALTLPRPLAGEMRRRYLPRALFTVAGLAVMLKLLGYSSYLGTLLSGAESETIAANHALEGLAAYVRSDDRLTAIFAGYEPDRLLSVLEATDTGRAFLGEFERFLQHYGHREVVISTALQPTWQDAPELVLGIIQGMVASGAPVPAPPAWQVKRDQILSHPWLKFHPIRELFLKLLDGARWLWRIREDTHFKVTTLLPIMRHLALELGQRLSCAGVINVPSEIFNLKLDELQQLDGSFPLSPALADEMRRIVSHRMQVRQSLDGLPVVDPRLFQQVSKAGDALLRGTAGGPGVVQGMVRVIHDAAEFGKLLPGEVLVAPYTNPAWTLLFQRACAVVVDGGAAGSHAAIVAREYGIPAVMGTVNGTHILHDGDWVVVDGTNGLVRAALSHEQAVIPEKIGGQPG